MRKTKLRDVIDYNLPLKIPNLLKEVIDVLEGWNFFHHLFTSNGTILRHLNFIEVKLGRVSGGEETLLEIFGHKMEPL